MRFLPLLGLTLAALLAPVAAFGAHPVTAASPSAPKAVPGVVQGEKIGIFDLAVMRATPLDPEILSSTEANGIVTEKIRYSALPGIRVFAYMSYPRGGHGLPTDVTIRNFGAESRVQDAQVGFVGFSACAPQANADTSKPLTVGGAASTETFPDDYTKSWVYQHVAIQLRGIDYLATRPEVDMKRLQVNGFSWSGFTAALLHAIDNRPAVYITWNSTGYFADLQGKSGDKPSRVTRKQYEMYCPSNYAQYGTQPIFVGNAITDYFATLDGAIDMYHKLQCPKQFVWAPNRYHADTARHEYASGGAYTTMYQLGGSKVASVNDGAFEVKNGKLLYKYYVNSNVTLTRSEVMYSYGSPGHWIGRTWHRIPAVLTGTEGYVAEIPVYDPEVPVYVVGQVETKEFMAAGNCPQVFIPKGGGLLQANATYPHMLMDFEDQSDLYFGSGEPTFVSPGFEGQYAASVEPFADGTVHLLNIEPFLWGGATELHFFLKGDGRTGPVNLYLVRDSDYYLDKDRVKDNSFINIVGKDEVFTEGWHEYSIPLNKIRDLKRVDSLWFEVSGRKLVIDGIQIK